MSCLVRVYTICRILFEFSVNLVIYISRALRVKENAINGRI